MAKKNSTNIIDQSYTPQKNSQISSTPQKHNLMGGNSLTTDIYDTNKTIEQLITIINFKKQ